MDSQPIPEPIPASLPNPNDQVTIVVRASERPFAPWQEPGTATSYGPIPFPAFTVCASIRRGQAEAASSGQRPVRGLRVSLKRLAEVSPFFENWSTSIPGCFEFEVVDIDAFAIVMDIIQQRFRRVPAYVNLEVLAKIAEIVSYLKCGHVMHTYPSRWMDALWAEKSYLSYGRKLVLWVHIANVFRDRAKFEIVTLRVMMTWGGKFDPLGLPLESINKRREETLCKVFTILHKFVRRLRKGETKCGSLCEATLLGSIFKQLPFRYFMPPPLAAGVSNTIVRVLEDILELKEPRPDGSDEESVSAEPASPSKSQSNTDPNKKSDCSEHERECGFRGLANDIETEVTRMKGLPLHDETGIEVLMEKYMVILNAIC